VVRLALGRRLDLDQILDGISGAADSQKEPS